MSVACKKKNKKQFRHSNVLQLYTTEIFIPLLQILATNINEVRRRKTVFLFKQ